MSESQQDGVRPERRRGYSELKAEIHRIFRRIWAIILIIGTTSTLALVGYGFALKEIQQQRLEVCEDQNRRNAAFVREYDRQIAKLPPKEQKEALENRDANITIVGALSPVQDCSKVVETGLEAYWPW